MDGGIFVNLFEIQVPVSIEAYSKPWDKASIEELYPKLYPVNVYGDNLLKKVFAYGEPESEDVYKLHGFTPDTTDTQENPKFVARFLIDAITYFLQTQGFTPARRTYTTYKRELINQTPLKTFYSSLSVYQAYDLQVMYLNPDGTLRYFLIVAPKLHQEFVISLERIQKKVDCTGRFVKITCPAECHLYQCDLHKWRGKLAGRLSGLTDKGFHCDYLSIQEGPNSHITLYDARLEYNIPAEVCHLEASLSNIRFVFDGVLDNKKVTELIRQIRVLSGDLQNDRVVNLEVGRKRYEECLSFVQTLREKFEVFGVELAVNQEPLRAVEGVPLSEEDIDFAIEEEDDDFEDIPF